MIRTQAHAAARITIVLEQAPRLTRGASETRTVMFPGLRVKLYPVTAAESGIKQRPTISIAAARSAAQDPTIYLQPPLKRCKSLRVAMQLA